MLWTKQQILTYLEKDKDGDIYECTRKQKKTVRSLAQNNYYFWVIINIISDFHGFTPIETHKLLKLTFKIDTTTWLSTKDFKWLIDSIIDMWKVTYWVIIPLPEDNNLLTFIDENT